MGRKGGIASGESRGREKRLREDAQLLADVLYQSEENKRFLESIKKMFT